MSTLSSRCTATPPARSTRVALISMFVSVALLAAGCAGSHTFNGTVYDPAPAAADFTGTNWDGSPFALSDLRGKVVLLFFGYTSCPDVCPTTLADMKILKSRLGDSADDVAVVFVSVDPERDDAERIGAYMQAFDPSFYGVSIPADDLPQVLKDYGAFAQKNVVDPQQSAAGYLVDHSAWTYVIDKEGRLRVAFSYDLETDQRVEDVTYLAGR